MAETNIHSRFIEAKYYHRGDASSVDFDLGDLTTDGTWRELDLSSIVPAGATATALHVRLTDNEANRFMVLRKNGDTGGENRSVIRTQVIDITISQDMIVGLDDDRKIQYNASNTTFSTIEITVKGWWK